MNLDLDGLSTLHFPLLRLLLVLGFHSTSFLNASPTDSFSPLLQRNAHSFALNLALLAPALFPLSSHSHPHLLCPCHNSFISISLSE